MPDYSGIGAGIGGLVGGPVGAGVGSLAGSVFSLISGANQKAEARKLLRDNPYPTYTIPKDIFENKQLAETMANEGLPSQQYQKAMKDIQRNQNTAVAQSTDRRSGNALIGAINQQSNDATNNLNAQDAAARQQNRRQLLAVNNQVAGYRDKAWDWNTKNRYEQNYNYAMSLLGAGNQNVSGGVDKGIAGLTYLSSGLFGGGNGAQPGPNPFGGPH